MSLLTVTFHETQSVKTMAGTAAFQDRNVEMFMRVKTVLDKKTKWH